MNKLSKIYIAGHRGLVGSAILRKLQENGYRRLVTRSHSELNLMDQNSVANFFEDEKPEYVFLAAAKVGGIHANNTYPADFIFKNLMIQSNVIHQSYMSHVKKLLFLGSSCIYPKECPQPIKEEYLLSGKLEPTNEPYAIAKIAGLKMCEAYNRQYGTCYFAVMPTNLYGKKDNFDLEDSHVLPAMIRKFHLAKLASEKRWKDIELDEIRFGKIPQAIKVALGIKNTNGQSVPETSEEPKIILWGSGAPRREFLHVDDLADACLFLMELSDQKLFKVFDNGSGNKSGAEKLINIGCGEDLTIRDLQELVGDIIGYHGPVQWNDGMPDGTPRKLLDISRLTSLGWRPKISLKNGIRNAYEWYCAQHSDLLNG